MYTIFIVIFTKGALTSINIALHSLMPVYHNNALHEPYAINLMSNYFSNYTNACCSMHNQDIAFWNIEIACNELYILTFNNTTCTYFPQHLATIRTEGKASRTSAKEWIHKLKLLQDQGHVIRQEVLLVLTDKEMIMKDIHTTVSCLVVICDIKKISVLSYVTQSMLQLINCNSWLCCFLIKLYLLSFL